MTAAEADASQLSAAEVGGEAETDSADHLDLGFLSNLKLAHLVETFRDNNIDADILALMSTEDLKELIPKIGDRVKIKSFIQRQSSQKLTFAIVEDPDEYIEVVSEPESKSSEDALSCASETAIRSNIAMKLKQELMIQPTGEVWKNIRVELKEDVATRDRDVAAIKEWLKKQPHLPDDWETAPIMTFLRGSSFSLEKCKRKLDMYFTMRAACPEFFTNRDATKPDLNEIMTNKIQGPPLPGVTPNGRRVTMCRGIHPNMDSQQIVDTLKLALMIGDVRLTEEKEGVAGDIYVLDAAVLGPSMLTKLSATTIKKFMICVQEAYPIKLKEVHIVNTSPIVERFINFVKPFLKEKIRKRIYIHKEIKDLYKYIPQDMLPEEYGGSCGTMASLQEQWKYKLQEYREWFKRQDSIVANETLRPGKPCNYDELFGIDGSFRQLAID